jgi:glycosyltransferase involved in cell wall biosynthesis
MRSSGAEGALPPLVSVVLPVYNAAPFLDQALLSIRGQTLKDIEIICINDGSTDDSPAILARHAEKDGRVKIVTQHNQGAGVARNRGLIEAVGEFVWFPDSDDLYHPDLLRKATQCAIANKSDVVVFKSEEIEENTNHRAVIEHALNERFLPLGESTYKPLSRAHCVFQPFNGWAWDKVFRRQLLTKHYLRFQALRTTNDLFLVLTAIVKARRLTVIREVLVQHRSGIQSSLAATRERSWYCCFEALAELREWLILHGLYRRTRQSFVNFAAALICWNLRTLKQPALREFGVELEKKFVWSLDLAGCPWRLFYENENYEALARFWRPSGKISLLRTLRSFYAIFRWKAYSLSYI